MASTFGKIFSVTTWGESHGPAVGSVLDGCPAGLEISENEIQAELNRRRPGQGKMTTARDEKDKVKPQFWHTEQNKMLKSETLMNGVNVSC